MSERDSSLVTFIVGAVIGAAAGLLLAPKSGRETRSDLKRLSEDISDTISDFTEDAKDKGRKFYEQGREKVLSGKDKINEVFEEGKKVFNKYKDEK
jgi:gas vesicle protein